MPRLPTTVQIFLFQFLSGLTLQNRWSMPEASIPIVRACGVRLSLFVSLRQGVSCDFCSPSASVSVCMLARPLEDPIGQSKAVSVNDLLVVI